MSSIIAKVWPNGEFSLFAKRKTLSLENDAPEVDPLGLSILPISHSLGEDDIEDAAERARRGTGGITPHGARMVRNAAYLLQKHAGNDTLSFLTCTLPSGAQRTLAAGREWAEIVRRFNQSIRRKLIACGLTGSLVGVTEIQEKRLDKEGGMPLHLHLVFRGRRPKGPWMLSPEEVTAVWARTVQSRVPGYEDADWSASINIQRVRKSAAGYLGKYMSKGGAVVDEIVKEGGEQADSLPSAWWFCSAKLKKAVMGRVRYSEDLGDKLERGILEDEMWFERVHRVMMDIGSGEPAQVAIVGKLNPVGQRALGLSVEIGVDLPTEERESTAKIVAERFG